MKKTDWFKERKWGIFNHYLASSVRGCGVGSKGEAEVSWEECVEQFDVPAYAKRVHELGAGYVIFTLSQGLRYLCAPNEAFDRIAGTKPGEACSRRDLPMELADELAKYDISLMLYFPSDGPHMDLEIAPHFGWDRSHDDPANGYMAPVTMEFVEKWSSVLQEYAERYGDKVKGWWLDGFYQWVGFDDHLIKYFHDAVLAGNPNAVMAFNGGVVRIDFLNPKYRYLTDGSENLFGKIDLLTKAAEAGDQTALEAFVNKPFRFSRYDDYCAGEQNEFSCYPEKTFPEDCQWHVLSFLANRSGAPGKKGLWGGGAGWCGTGSAYSADEILDYVKKVNDLGGVVSIEIRIYRDGSFDKAQMEVLRKLKTLR